MARSIRDFARRRIHAGRYAPDIHGNAGILARRLGDGEFPVIYTTIGDRYPLGAANYVGRIIGDRPALFLPFFTWASHGKPAVERSRRAISVYRNRRPQHRFVFACNSESERAAHAAAGLDAILCNHNAFVDEAIFTAGDAPILYDAVYNAGMVGWKRRELSELVASCAHITYWASGLTSAEALDLLSEFRRRMPHHHFANPVIDGQIIQLQAVDVAAILSQCRCGLALSAVEGAMFASIEYLLAGLPVVSTPSVGGREEFADPDYWLTVPAEAKAVAAGVSEMISRGISREDIHNRTVERMKEHRRRLRDTVAQSTDGAVLLPADLGDTTYRFMTDIVPWPRAADLENLLGLRGLRQNR
ncbi:MAG: glycosyltransferase [Devosia sp.]